MVEVGIIYSRKGTTVATLPVTLKLSGHERLNNDEILMNTDKCDSDTNQFNCPRLHCSLFTVHCSPFTVGLPTKGRVKVAQ